MKDFLYKVITDQKKGPLISVVKSILRVLAFIYRAGLYIHRGLYKFGILKVIRLPYPVISVGNITWGGVGKTPIVEYLVKYLLDHSYNPVILTRGYQGSQEAQASDEADMLKRTFPSVPILIGGRRAQNALRYLQEDKPVDVFILDDGYQHWRLARDWDILAIDCLNPFGNQFLIPRGILREPRDAIKRADTIALTKCTQSRSHAENLDHFLRKSYPKKVIIKTDHHSVELIDWITGQPKDLSFIQNQNVCCFCGIGNPLSFFQSIQELGASIQKKFLFRDHHTYSDADLQNIVAYCDQNHIQTVVTTAKDASNMKRVRVDVPPQIRIYILKIELVILQGKEQFIERVKRVLRH